MLDLTHLFDETKPQWKEDTPAPSEVSLHRLPQRTLQYLYKAMKSPKEHPDLASMQYVYYTESDEILQTRTDLASDYVEGNADDSTNTMSLLYDMLEQSQYTYALTPHRMQSLPMYVPHG